MLGLGVLLRDIATLSYEELGIKPRNCAIMGYGYHMDA